MVNLPQIFEYKYLLQEFCFGLFLVFSQLKKERISNPLDVDFPLEMG